MAECHLARLAHGQRQGFIPEGARTDRLPVDLDKKIVPGKRLMIDGLNPLGVQADSIETIQLHNRPAAEVIPIIQPMLDAGGSVTGQGFQLFVRSGEQNLVQIRQLVEKLDTAARQLLMQVGFSESEARKQIARFQLTPGYQLCYSFGRNEIMRLRSIYEQHDTRKSFHAFMLAGGQLPFHLIEKRMAK